MRDPATIRRVKPRDWCDPKTAFGDPNAKARAWVVPVHGSDLPEFRAAVVQHAIAISVRRYKNNHGVTQHDLAQQDDRRQESLKWNSRLNGRHGLTLTDLTVILRVLPGAMPSEGSIRRLLKVAQGAPRPAGWTEVDTRKP